MAPTVEISQCTTPGGHADSVGVAARAGPHRAGNESRACAVDLEPRKIQLVIAAIVHPRLVNAKVSERIRLRVNVPNSGLRSIENPIVGVRAKHHPLGAIIGAFEVPVVWVVAELCARRCAWRAGACVSVAE
jgi:hypothetical protein